MLIKIDRGLSREPGGAHIPLCNKAIKKAMVLDNCARVVIPDHNGSAVVARVRGNTFAEKEISVTLEPINIV